MKQIIYITSDDPAIIQRAKDFISSKREEYMLGGKYVKTIPSENNNGKITVFSHIINKYIGTNNQGHFDKGKNDTILKLTINNDLSTSIIKTSKFR